MAEQHPSHESGGIGWQPLARSVFLTTFLGAVIVVGTVLFYIFAGGEDLIARLIPANSSFAGDIDFVILVIAGIVGFWFFASLFAFFVLLYQSRRRPGHKPEYLAKHDHQLHTWVSWPHWLVIACDLIIIIVAVKVWHQVKQVAPPADTVIRVVAQQWGWTFRHPGTDNKLDTVDDIVTIDRLHVPLDQVVHFELQSKDVMHDFSVPVFRLKQDAVPGRTIKGWFKPVKAGAFDIQCAEMCGIGHGLMPARIFVETPEQHAAFLEDSARNASVPGGQSIY
ncbi:MAG: cytochrome C oxidase subunit II [Candidatus Sericytochromatia bacterium]|nr:cytochrome C oxidase subunit II [Candidatus Tanganyikabacteria bacterium]